jgi:hypothetical protein
MDKPISVGDLVVVVSDRICCHNPEANYGETFRVTRFRDATGEPCEGCGDKSPQTNALGEGHKRGYDVRRLKRIPPLSELEGEKRDEKIKELA